jgi:tRNA 2-selenouridine synthase
MANPDIIEDLSPASLAAFDDIIDVRSPAEFDEDHLPGAINLPVLDNDERARVGTIYVQDSPFLARRTGGAIVARNISRHIETALSDRPQGWRPLVYCWRGGQRSRAMAIVLSQVGWRVGLVLDGYKRWRREVTSGLMQDAAPLNLVLLDGGTGSGKTAVLRRLEETGAQAIDLEGLAGHRGSAFGAPPGVVQPGQKQFETRLWDSLRRFDLSRPVIVEAESNRIGRVRIPGRVWSAMQRAPRIEISAPAGERARYIATAYADLTADPERVLAAIDMLRPMHAKARIDAWIELARAAHWEALALDLVREHYDAVYARARMRWTGGDVARRISVDAVNADGVERMAAEIWATGLIWGDSRTGGRGG